jgi:hypothetical protein
VKKHVADNSNRLSFVLGLTAPTTTKTTAIVKANGPTIQTRH